MRAKAPLRRGKRAKVAEPQTLSIHTGDGQLRCSKTFVARLDDLRRIEPDIPNRTEMLRRLVNAAWEKVQ